MKKYIALILFVLITGCSNVDVLIAPETQVPVVKENNNDPTGSEGYDTEPTLFSGVLEKVNTGCFADGECYVEVDGKNVTAIIGRSRETVGSINGVDGFGDLESHIGKIVEVYAQELENGNYTLYGNSEFYIAAESNQETEKGLTYDALIKMHNKRFPKDKCNTKYLTSFPPHKKLEVHPVEDNQLLYIAICSIHAYQSSFVIYSQFTEVPYGNIPDPKGLVFSRYQEGKMVGGNHWIIDPEYNPKTKVLTTRSKGRGIGDCGEKAVYQWKNKNGGSFDMLKYWSKEECDGDIESEWPIVWEKEPTKKEKSAE